MKRLLAFFLLLTATPVCASSAPVMTDAQAAAQVTASSYEAYPENWQANHTTPTATQLTSFYANPLDFLSGPPASDFSAVDGAYQGSTDQIIQWAAAKWGMDPNYLRAEVNAETGGDHGVFGDKQYTQSACQSPYWNGWITNFEGVGGCVTSYGITQVKVTSYNAYPYVRTSTAFNLDFRAAVWASCVAGDWANYFAGQPAPQPGYPTYAASTYQQRVDGCMGSWYSGSWYDSGAISYIATVQGYETTKPWLTGAAITAPLNGATVSGTIGVTLQLNTTDPDQCYACLYFNGVDEGCNGQSTQYSVDTTATAGGIDGQSTLRVQTFDCNNNLHLTNGVTVKVNN